METEWNFEDRTSSIVTQILQLLFPGCPVAVIHLGAMFAVSPDSLPTELKKLLTFPNLAACGLATCGW